MKNVKVEEFIKQYSYLINENKWEELYGRTISNQFSAYDVGEFTKTILECDINPLLYMSYVPKYYLCGVENIANINIPDNIYSIFKGAFWDSNIESIYIPSTINSIYECAFKNCKNLKHIYLEDLEKFTGIYFLGYCSNPFYCSPNVKGYINNISFEHLNIGYEIKSHNNISTTIYEDEVEDITFYRNVDDMMGLNTNSFDKPLILRGY